MRRTIEYLSPSAISLYHKDEREYYRRYLCNNRPAREPQTNAMAIGSAFDAYVKSYLHKTLNKDHDERFDLRKLFEAQVDPSLWEWAWVHGSYVFEQYKQSGCLGDLMLLLKNSVSSRFEFEIRGVVSGYREGKTERFGQVVLLGKPDVDFVTADGVHVILDFKVNGYCSNYAMSPKPGYHRLRTAGGTSYGSHKSYAGYAYKGMMVNYGNTLENIDESWARQLAIYGWLCGNPIGSEFVTIIHQLVCDGRESGKGILPSIKVAEHVNFISKEFQQRVFDEAVMLWEFVHSDHFFRSMTKEQSQDLCKLLDEPLDERLAWMNMG